MIQVPYDPLDFLSQATADFDVGNRPNGFPEFGNRALTIHNLAKFYAKAARDEHYRAVRKNGRMARRWVLKDQLEKYQSLNVEGRGSRDIYYVDVY